MPTGRPSSFPKTDAEICDLCDRMVAAGDQGMSEVEIACEIGIPRQTMRDWAEGGKDPRFSAAFARAKEASQAWWERNAREAKIGTLPGQINPSIWKHVVACRFKEDYSERHLHIHEGGETPIGIEHDAKRTIARQLARLAAGSAPGEGAGEAE